VGFDYSWNRSLYRVESSKDREIAGRTVNSSLNYKVGSTSFGAELKSEKKRNEYFNFQTGDIYHKTFGASLKHEFGPRFDATLRARTGLIAYHYDDIEENDQDRDLFDQEASLHLSYSPTHDISTALLVRIRENQLIYMRRSRSGDNKTTQTYTIQPSFTKNFTRRFSVGQKYELSADYTFYSYDRDSNFLIRGLAVKTDITWKPIKPLTLHIDHKYSSRDEGAYVEDEYGVERYGKNRERDDHGITVRVQYKLAGAINVEASQTFNVKRNWSFYDGEREFDWERFDKSFSIKAGSERRLPNGSTLKFSVGRTLKDATSINERQRDVWNITLNLDRTF
jgi:hypothetical protein